MIESPTQPVARARRNTSRLIRYASSGVVLLVMVIVAWVIFHHRLPRPAPDVVQQNGIAKVRQILTTVSQTLWGGSQRGQLLLVTLNKLLDEDRIIFTDQLADSGLTLRGQKGRKCIYIKVLLAEQGQYQHHDPPLLCDVIFHEALHVTCEQPNCIEQECDAFLAGLQARNAFENRPRPVRFMVEGRSIASFVLDRYPELSRDATYKPLASDMDWLAEQTQLK